MWLNIKDLPCLHNCEKEESSLSALNLMELLLFGLGLDLLSEIQSLILISIYFTT